jgi:hypothetical protein
MRKTIKNRSARCGEPAKPNGHPPFVPTDEQRSFIAAMSGVRMTWEKMRQLVVNPETGRPISQRVLGKAFKRELAAGRASHKSLIATGYYAALRERQPWALTLGRRTQFGLRQDGLLPPDHPGEGQGPSIRVTFVRPDPKMLEDDNPVVQPQPYDPTRHYQKLLPAPTERAMPDLSKRKGSRMD